MKKIPRSHLSLLATVVAVVLWSSWRPYARVPFFDWLRPVFAWQRNHYDRLGHLMQGFVPAMIAREILIRFDVLKRQKWLTYLVLSICLGISAFYELIEWLVALVSGAATADFLGTQGDVWDTQSDMFLALVGAISALLLLSALHNRQIRKLDENVP